MVDKFNASNQCDNVISLLYVVDETIEREDYDDAQATLEEVFEQLASLKDDVEELYDLQEREDE